MPDRRPFTGGFKWSAGRAGFTATLIAGWQKKELFASLIPPAQVRSRSKVLMTADTAYSALGSRPRLFVGLGHSTHIITN